MLTKEFGHAPALSVPCALISDSKNLKAEQLDNEQAKTIADMDQSFRSIDKCLVLVLLTTVEDLILFSGQGYALSYSF